MTDEFSCPFKLTEVGKLMYLGFLSSSSQSMFVGVHQHYQREIVAGFILYRSVGATNTYPSNPVDITRVPHLKANGPFLGQVTFFPPAFWSAFQVSAPEWGRRNACASSIVCWATRWNPSVSRCQTLNGTPGDSFIDHTNQRVPPLPCWLPIPQPESLGSALLNTSQQTRPLPWVNSAPSPITRSHH